MKRTKSIAWLACLLTVLPLGASAEPDPEAQKWLDMATLAYTAGPYTLTYHLDMNISQQGVEMSMNALGKMLYQGPKAMRVDLDMTMKLPGDNPPMTMTTVVVHDGETLWTEVSNPLLGKKQVVKMTAEAAEKVAADRMSGLMGGMNPSQLDPASQMELLARMADLKVVKRADGKVTLGGPVTDEFRESMGPGAAALFGEGQAELSFVLDQKSGQLYEMTLGSDGKTFLTGRFEDMKYLNANEIPKDAFFYQPPEGAMVNDMTAVVENSAKKSEQP